MGSTLVSTKLRVPVPRSALVARPRLTMLLEQGAGAALTLVSAPPGFGKTTVISSWLAEQEPARRAVAWVSLDDADSRARQFWEYAVTALHSAVPGVGASVLPLLASGQPASRAVLTSVLNDVAAQPREVELVLDDYHLADGGEVAEGMTFLLDHRPPNLHVVISTRADPELPLSRLRARGELVEIRARDLRFTSGETASYLADVSGLAVADAEVSALESRTEGWAAALQLAALSMHGRDDVGAFVEGFAGTDRHVVDYLVDEVLSRQSEEIRTFLARTSVLERLCGDLCDAVLERTGSQSVLESVERANLLLVPLDDHRRWYRYHHLFADVLRAHLHAEQPDLVPVLHARASRWYADAGEPVPAVRHALAAGDLEGAADLVERATPALRRDRQEVTLRAWVDDVPDSVVRRRPVVALAFIGGLMSSNDFALVGDRLDALEAQLPEIRARIVDGPGSASGLVAVDEAELARAPAAIELYRAGLALVGGDLEATHRHAALASATALPDDDVVRSGAAGLSGLAHWAVGELDDAYRLYTVCVQGLRRAQHLSDALGCLLTMAEIRAAQGRLHDAAVVYDEALALAQRRPGAPMRGVADVHVGRAEVALERGDLDAARGLLAEAQEAGDELGLPRFPFRSRAVTSLLAEAEGDLERALDLVEQAGRVYLGDFSPDVRPLHAWAARLRVRLGDLDGAGRWAREHGLGADDDLSYLRELEHLVLAELLLARHRSGRDAAALVAARGLLRRLRAAAEAGGRGATVVDAVTLEALAAHAAGEVDAALDSLDLAVRLCEPEGRRRALTRHGELLVPLLEALVERPGASPYAGVLLDACREVPVAEPARDAAPAGSGEGLSPRELEVLRLLASDLDGPEIARALFVSLNTLRTHTRSIYAKLGVTSRRAAVRRGQELGLLSR